MHKSSIIDIIIVGAGISGLTTAYNLINKGWRVLLLEDSTRTGGKINTQRKSDYLLEYGPNSLLNNSPIISKLINDLLLQKKYIAAESAAKKHYIVRNGRLSLIPSNPLSMLTSSTFSMKAKLSLLCEIFVKQKNSDKEESISEFVERRLSKEFLDYAIEPLVGGIYAGDPDLLSIKDALPNLYKAEQEYNSLIRSQISATNETKRETFSFDDGLCVLTDALTFALPPSAVMLNTKVGNIKSTMNGKISVIAIRNNEALNFTARAVVLATPADSSAKIISSFAPDSAAALNEIQYAPMAVHIGMWNKKNVANSLDGFGFLAPRLENRKLLGTLFSSSIFKHRAPENHLLLTSYLGGQRQKELLTEDDLALQQIVLQEHQSLLGCSGQPELQQIIRHQRAIPQYNIGHAIRVERANNVKRVMPTLSFCASWCGGVSVVDCIKSASKAADSVNETLRKLLPFTD